LLVSCCQNNIFFSKFTEENLLNPNVAHLQSDSEKLWKLSEEWTQSKEKVEQCDTGSTEEVENT